MIWGPKTGITLLVLLVFTFIVIDVGYKAYMAEDVNKSVQHAGKGAMTLSINKGVLRQQEEMTIDSERVPGYFDEIRANNHSIANAVQGTAFGEMSEFPPMIPVVIRGQSKGMFKQFLSDSDDSLIEHINPEIIIYERK